MGWMNRYRLGRGGAIVVSALAIVFAVVWVGTGLDGGALFGIAIAFAIAIAIFSSTQDTCSPRSFRRRD